MSSMQQPQLHNGIRNKSAQLEQKVEFFHEKLENEKLESVAAFVSINAM
jgi:hypothetical protein